MTSTLFPPQPVRSVAAASLLLAALVGSGCASLSARDRNTAVGAAVGGVAGSVLTDGSAIGTLGGAVIGGVIGREADTGERKDERDRRKRDRRD